MRHLVYFLLLSVLFTLKVRGQDAEPIAVIQTDGLFSLVRANGRMEPLPYYILGLEGEKEGLNQAKIVLPGQEAKTVFINKEGKIVLEPDLHRKVEGLFSGFENGYSVFQGFDLESNKPFANLISKDGELLNEDGFEEISTLGTNKWIYIHSEDFHGFYTEKLKEKLKLPDSIKGSPFVGDLAVVTNNNTGSIGVIDTKGNYVLKPEFAQIDIQKEGQNTLIVQDFFGKSFLYDAKGKLIKDLPGTPEGNFSEGMLPVYDGEKYVFVNAKGETMIELPDALMVHPFANGLATVQMNGGGYVLINTSGEIQTAFPYQNMEPFVDGYAYFIDGDRSGYVDMEGNEIELNYEMIWDLRTSKAIF